LADTRGIIAYSVAGHSEEDDHCYDDSFAVLLDSAAKAAGAAAAGQCVLFLVGPDCAGLIELTEALGHAVAKRLPGSQVPIFVVGSPAKLLRHCTSFTEWAHRDRAARASAGLAPYLIEELMATDRLVLAGSLHELADTYYEPCIVMAADPAGGTPVVARHFQARWKATGVVFQTISTDNLSGTAMGQAVSPKSSCGTIDWRLRPREVHELLTRDGLQVALLPSYIKGPAGLPHMLHLEHAKWLTVPLDFISPSIPCWMPARILHDVASPCRFDGVAVGSKRRRLNEGCSATAAGPPAELPILVGSIDMEALINKFKQLGHTGRSLTTRDVVSLQGSAVLELPALQASVMLNIVGAEDDSGFETFIEAPSRGTRLMIANVIESLLLNL